MIKILVVEDNLHKLENIKDVILDNSGISESDIHLVNCIKEAKKLLFNNTYDLLILDLVLPIEPELDAEAKNGVQFLEDLHSNPYLKPPTHILGLSGYIDKITEYDQSFKSKLWNLIKYEANSTEWSEQLKNIIFHLVKIRQQFLDKAKSVHIFDVAIITALPTPEFEAILKLNKKGWEEFEIQGDYTKYYKTTFIKGEKEKTIVAASADQMGMTASSHLATKMIYLFKPKYLIMGGIAAGIKDRGLGFGDILIAEQSWDYGSGKIIEIANGKENEINDIRFQADPKAIQLNPELKAKINNFKLRRKSIIDSIQNEWDGNSPNTKLQVHLGPIGTGSYVISSEVALGEIKNYQRKLLGVEMETFGIYYAAEHSPEPKTKGISIKSVSDFGDGKKNDNFQKYAAYTSAKFIYHFIMEEL